MDHRTGLGIALLVLGGAVLWQFGGGLFAADDIDTDVTIEPHPNNGDYVVSADGDEVAIDVTTGNENLSAALNDDATTYIDDVVLLTNDKSTSVSVWLDDASADVTFYQSVAGRPSLEGSANAVDVPAGDTLDVGMKLDTSGSDDVESLTEVTFNVSTDGDGGATTTTSSDSDLLETPTPDPTVVVHEATGDRLDATVKYLDAEESFTIDSENTGEDPLVRTDPVALDDLTIVAGDDGDHPLNVSATGAVSGTGGANDFEGATGTTPLGTIAVEQPSGVSTVKSTTLRLSVDESAVTGPEAVAFYRPSGDSWRALDATRLDADGDEYAFAVEDVDPGSVVLGRRTASFSVSDASVSETRIDAGDDVTVSATVRNDGPVSGSHAVSLSVDGEPVRSRTVRLAAGDDERVSFSRRFSDAGTYALAVDGAPAGTVTVRSVTPEENDTDAETGPDASVPWWPPSERTPDPPSGPAPQTTTTERPTPEPTPTATSSSPISALTNLDFSDLDREAALAFSAMSLFVLFGLVLYVRRRLR